MLNFAEKIIAKLNEAEVEYVVVGGLSAVLQGAPIVTQDIDICYRRTGENCAKLAMALSSLQPKLRGLAPGLPNIFDERSLQLGTNFTLEIEDQAVDLLGVMAAIGGYEDVVDKSVQLEVAGNRVKVLALKDLIETKRTVNRPKDLAVLPI